MQLFYNPSLAKDTKMLSFDKVESRHIIKVLRKKEGDLLQITNGNGLLFEAVIFEANEKHCLVTITSISEKPKSHPYYLHIAIAPTKLNERFEWFLEKATEIGVDEITPLLCEHSERKVVKSDRLEKILISASKQSLHFHHPKLNELTPFSNFLAQEFKGLKLIAHCDDQDKIPLKQLVKPNERVTILIGPEGDFSLKEIKLALKNAYKSVSLGNSRLRTETAGVVACHSIAFINE
ncbi:MAG: 16S rRNA (uracil(1498)-N(3))-methyltransferase [Flavobacteriales bacterium CG_4_9_14_0_2_um_filter_35_242]|nr:16S rRNA (uracil(1498)-N(3))-methyltransferase [Zetaproteobacteria bacterium]NDK17768.1 16S rRNA (uracil(1498)-N(3))-methyltransferase [Flavobacteriales bacterium]OIO12974.1 MAG: 16S rRNA (uracil(1498)-N(3))-methyltransferase [Flavobacteriaceae bacterium CG1_02_35_72]PIR14469.1 MAG: 16S rRNA (uracil(1498)-N(3))-methyltransferase [Flavobacteriales bacterium CG11_big_fil_rev_8_21_14_0_20_35_7]PIV16371.1 MAG: 16S rRNA (uracil(1498)-N(3))-methyltransferase [Flavobacteriales bacterium CG03_land_8